MTDRLREIEGVDVLAVAEKHAPEVVYLALKEALSELASARAQEEQLREVVEDFLREEYPNGTDHPADHAAARLARTLAAVSAARDPEGQTR